MARSQNRDSSLKSIRGGVTGWVLRILLLVGLAGGAWYYFTNKDAPDADKRSGSKNRPVSVAVGEVKTGDITVSLSALGTVTPRNTVTVYPQVGGVLTGVFFKEGDMVEAGQLLAQIDPRIYEATLKQAQGALERDKMLLSNAQTDLKRYETLIAQDSVSTQIYDTQRALVDQYKASALTDQGLLDSAKLQVEFAKIISPISGRIGLRLVDPGNLVQANNSSSLFVITQVSPTTVIFAVPQSLLLTYLEKLNPSMVPPKPGSSAKGESTNSNVRPWSSNSSKSIKSDKTAESNNSIKGAAVEIEAWDSDNKFLLDKGKLDSIDNVIDLTTGTVKLRAVFPNKKGTLFANQFVNVKSILEIKKDVVFMPLTAMQKGINGTFVYKVNEDGKTVSVAPVKLGPTDQDKILVESGLVPGDKVVVDGLDKLREGASILITEAAKPGGAGGSRGRKGAEEKSPPLKAEPGAAPLPAYPAASAVPPPPPGVENKPESKPSQNNGEPKASGNWDNKRANN